VETTPPVREWQQIEGFRFYSRLDRLQCSYTKNISEIVYHIVAHTKNWFTILHSKVPCIIVRIILQNVSSLINHLFLPRPIRAGSNCNLKRLLYEILRIITNMRLVLSSLHCISGQVLIAMFEIRPRTLASLIELLLYQTLYQ